MFYIVNHYISLKKTLELLLLFRILNVYLYTIYYYVVVSYAKVSYCFSEYKYVLVYKYNNNDV